MLKRTKLFQALLATGLIAGMNVASANLWTDAGMTNAVNHDGNNKYTVQGDAYLNNHTYFSGQNSFIDIGGSLYRTGEAGHAKLELYDHTTVHVAKDVVLDNLTNPGVVEIGGSLTVGELHQFNKLTGKDGAAIGKIVAGSFYNHTAGVYGDLTVTDHLETQGADLTLTGTVGSADKVAGVTNTNGNITVLGNVYTNRVSMTNGNVSVKGGGTLELNGGWAMVTGTGKEVLEATDIVVKGNGTVYGSELKANTFTVDGTSANRLFTVAYDENKLNPGKLNVNTLVLDGDVNFQHHDLDHALTVNKVVLNTQSKNYFQVYGSLDVGTLEVDGAARVDGYMKGSAPYDIPLAIKTVNVKKGASLTFSNTNGTGNSAASIGEIVLEEGASLANAAYKDDGTTLRKGYQLAVNNLHAKDAVITTLDGTTTLGANNGTVQISGTVNDRNAGKTVLNLNSADDYWTATGASKLDTLKTNGGTTDISQTTGDVAVTNLDGTGIVLMDAAGENKLTATNTAGGTRIVARATKTADDVSAEEAAGMIARLEGVDEAAKSAVVDEGMYNGAITVDGTGSVVVKANGLMADALELGSASTLSVNRILMNDVRKRLGNIRMTEGTEGVWARYDGGRLSGNGTKTKFHTFQAGADTLLSAAPVRLGLSGSYTTGDADYTRGDADLDVWSLGAYALWTADNGAFADVIARIARTESDLTVDGIHKGKLNNWASSLSGEFGWHFEVGGNFYAEPQLEVTYTHVDSDNLKLQGSGTTYSYNFDSFDSVIGRAGGLVGMKCPNGKGDFYARASLVHEFMGDSTIVAANGTRIENDGKDTWVEYGVGANFNITPTTYFWLDLERTSGATVDEDIRATVGIRHAF